jgi:hypothetical protein
MMAGLVQTQPVLKVEGGVIQVLDDLLFLFSEQIIVVTYEQTPTLSDYDPHYGGLSTCTSPYMVSQQVKPCALYIYKLIIN